MSFDVYTFLGECGFNAGEGAKSDFWAMAVAVVALILVFLLGGFILIPRHLKSGFFFSPFPLFPAYFFSMYSQFVAKFSDRQRLSRCFWYVLMGKS